MGWRGGAARASRPRSEGVCAGAHGAERCMRLLMRWRGRTPVGEGVQISERDGMRYLHLGSDTVQSGMSLADPIELVLSYTRSMLAFLLFVPEPPRLLNIGLGGGSLAKWIHRHLVNTQQLVLEISPQVIACARSH